MAPLFLDTLHAGHDLGQPRAQAQSRRIEWCQPIIGQGTSDRNRVATDQVGGRIITLLDSSLEWANATHVLLELLLGVPVSFEDRCGSFAQLVELTQLMRDVTKDRGNGLADRLLAVGDDGGNRHLQRVTNLAQQLGQIGLVEDSRRRTSRISRESTSRSSHKTSWPTSGCMPSSARMTRWCGVVRRRRRAMSSTVRASSSS